MTVAMLYNSQREIHLLWKCTKCVHLPVCLYTVILHRRYCSIVVLEIRFPIHASQCGMFRIYVKENASEKYLIYKKVIFKSNNKSLLHIYFLTLISNETVYISQYIFVISAKISELSI